MQFDWETFTYDEEWLREAVRQEEEAGCDIAAGNDWGAHLGNVMANPKGYSHFTMLRSMVTQGWKRLVAEWDLGVSREAAEAKGQELIFERLRDPQPAIQEKLIALLEAKLSRPQGEWEMTEAVHAEIRSVLSQVLTQEDWNAIAASASDRIRHQVLAQDLAAVASRG
ncbi:MAG: hypothetical protein AAGG53_06905 [Cyanobacteria bacterium P01_H01_bin.152]